MAKGLFQLLSDVADGTVTKENLKTSFEDQIQSGGYTLTDEQKDALKKALDTEEPLDWVKFLCKLDSEAVEIKLSC